MNAFLIVVPILLITGLFVVMSLAAFIDMRDPALQPERPAPAPRSTAQRRPRLRIQPYPQPYAHAFVTDSARPVQRAAQSKERKLHLHTQTGIRWLSVFFLFVIVGSALAVTPALAAQGRPTAVVKTGRLNGRTGPGVSYSVVTRIDEGTSASLGRNCAATCVQVHLAGSMEGWVNISCLRAAVLIGDLPVNDPSIPTPATGAVTAA